MLPLLLPLLPLLATLPHPCSAASLLITIAPSTHLANPNTLPASTHATLLSGDGLVPAISSPLSARSSIEFHNLSLPASADPRAQSHLLTISALTHVFASYRVDLIPGGSADGGAVIEGIWETYPGAAWADRGPILGGKAAQGGGASGAVVDSARGSSSGGPEQEQTVRIDAKVLSRREFYEQRAGFNLLGLLMNPMVLLGGLALGITFGMPYLMDNSMRSIPPSSSILIPILYRSTLLLSCNILLPSDTTKHPPKL